MNHTKNVVESMGLKSVILAKYNIVHVNSVVLSVSSDSGPPWAENGQTNS
jgi:hypothetical protein